MGKYIIIIMILAVAIPIAIEQLWPVPFKNWLENHKLFISSVNILSIFGLLLSLYLTVYHFNETQRRQEETAILEYTTRIATLIKEFEVNQSICENEIFSLYEKYKEKEALPVPESRLHVDILKAMLISGGITEEKTNTALWNCYRYMETINSLLDQAIEIRHYEHIADPRDMLSISGRRGKINDLVKGALDYTIKVIEIIPTILELLEKTKKA